METEEGEEVKEDEEVEFDVVEGADSPLVDDVGSCGINEAAMLFSVVRGMWTKPSKKQTETKNKEKTSRSHRERRRTARRGEIRRGKPRKMADRTQHEGKLNAPMNHMIDVASYWACACQRPLTSGN